MYGSVRSKWGGRFIFNFGVVAVDAPPLGRHGRRAIHTGAVAVAPPPGI